MRIILDQRLPRMVHHTIKMKIARASPASRKITHMDRPPPTDQHHFTRPRRAIGPSRGGFDLLGQLALALGLLFSLLPTHVQAEAKFRPVSFKELPGWAEDDLQGFGSAFSTNCGVMRLRATAWARICKEAEQLVTNDAQGLRQLVESRFTPHELTDSRGTRSGLITGYYEPLLRGSRTKNSDYQIPLYKTPKDLVNVDLSAIYPEIKSLRLRGRLEGNRVVPYPTRAEIETKRLLAGQELLWVDDPVEAFFLQVQGSGRVQLPNGETVRVGYAEQNGYPYRSIGRYLIDKGELKPNDASMQSIKAWVAANPHRRDEVLHQNPSVVFFKEITALPAAQGPLGSMGLPLTAGRSAAVDPRFISAGSLIFMSTRVPKTGAPPKDPGVPFQRLMIAQDTGSAVQGAHRSDIFFGTGSEAGEVAGRMRAEGRVFVLLPN